MVIMVDVIRVLYVDDKPDLLELGKIYLQKSGNFSVTTVESAQEALVLLQSSHFDAIISDYQMPIMDGLCFLCEVRKKHGQVPFILFTEKGREEVVVDAINSGVDFYIQKGGDLVAQYAELSYKVRLAVERHTVNQALKESEERFRGITERISDLIIIADQEGPTYVSPSVSSILGFPPEYYIGKGANPEIFPPEDLGKLVTAMERLAQGSPGEQVEFRMKKKDGTYAVFEGKGTPVLKGGAYTGVQVVARDITDRKQAEQSLHLQHDLSLELNTCNTLDEACDRILSALLKIGGLDSGGIYIADSATGRLDLHVSRGLTPGFVSHVSRFDPDTPQVQWARAGVPFYGKFADIRQPGHDEIRDMEGITAVATIPVLHEGNLIALVNVGSHNLDDIPESVRQILETLALWVGSTVNRIRSRMMLFESEERYRTLVENLNDVVFTVGPDWVITYVSPVAERQFGYSITDLLGKSFTDIVFSDDVSRLRKRPHEISGGLIGPIDWRLVHRDGTLSWVRSSTRPFTDTTGNRSFFGIISNISQQKQDEEAIRRANRKLTLLTGITRHDINNQLTVLMGYLDLMKNQPHDRSFDEYFPKMDVVTERISSMIRFTKEYEEIGVRVPVWQECCSLVDSAAKGAPLGKVAVENVLPAGMEVLADPLISKVFYNLMDNAARYGGGITKIRFSGEKRNHDQVIVCEDDGVGIPAADKEKIFERGFGKNTGMGLALTREVLDITGISITETGKPGNGARFEMVIPEGTWRVSDDDGT